MNDSFGEMMASFFVLGVLLIGAWIWASMSCAERGSQMGLRSDYSLIAGCMIQVKGQWTPLENYRVL